MPSRPNHFCSRCNKVHGKVCPKRKAFETPGRRRGSRHERGYGSTWVRLREVILERDKRLCQVCLAKGIYTPATAVDHIQPKEESGTDDPGNLQAICEPCHRAKTAREGQRGSVKNSDTGEGGV